MKVASDGARDLGESPEVLKMIIRALMEELKTMQHLFGVADLRVMKGTYDLEVGHFEGLPMWRSSRGYRSFTPLIVVDMTQKDGGSR